eukprot:TRINITY_DN5900_c0_g1_i1.p1 TRINITY_DN5900_c0_g1~~TRINITY_DN5900_c0_g1_i1.p1  ORF type:complete len:723 (+),score=241.28 TRINITY_DN5900_c0_g1_i1:57-2171(+)
MTDPGPAIPSALSQMPTAMPWDEVSGAMQTQTNRTTEFLRQLYDQLRQQNVELGELKRLCALQSAKLEEFQSTTEQRFGDVTRRLDALDEDRQRRWDEHLRLHDREQREHADALAAMSARQQRTEDVLAEEQVRRLELERGLDELGGRLQAEIASNASEKKTIRETVDELSENHNKLVIVMIKERLGRMRATAWWLKDLNLKGRIWGYFQKWLSWKNMTADERQAAEGKEMRAMQRLSVNKKMLMQRYFAHLQQFLKFAQRKRFLADRYRRAMRKLVYLDGKLTMRRYWGKLLSFLAVIDKERLERQKMNEQFAATLADISMKALTNRFLQRWIRFRYARAERARKLRNTDSMQDLSHNAVRSRFYKTLLRHLRWRQYRRKRAMAVGMLEQGSARKVLQKYIERLAAHARRVRRSLERRAAATALSTKNGQMHRRECWRKLVRHAAEATRQRRLAEQEGRLLETGRRVDILSTHVDVSLKTLSNTNNVLNKLVDRVISVDEQLDVLSREKVGKRELRFITGDSAGADSSSPRRHADPRSPSPTHQRQPRAYSSSVPAVAPPLAEHFDSLSRQDARHEELEREREQERAEQQRRQQEMEEKGERLERIVQSITAGEWPALGAAVPAPVPTPPPARGIQRPLVTPAAAPLPSSQPGRLGGPSPSSVDSADYSYQYRTEFQRLLAIEQAQLSGASTPLFQHSYYQMP